MVYFQEYSLLSQLKSCAEKIEFKDKHNFLAEPASEMSDNTNAFNWIVYDEHGNKIADVIFTKSKVPIKKDDQVMYSVEVITDYDIK